MKKTGVYFCNCGNNISDKIDSELVRQKIDKIDGVEYFQTIDFMCDEAGKEFLENDLKDKKPERIVIAACSPRDHENTFRRICTKAEMNPYLMQMVNIREQVAWVTEDKNKAVEKATSYIKGAIKRVNLQEPLEKRYVEVCSDALVIGAGPAGIKAALALAEAGRNVTLVEKAPLIGGKPVFFEELFPNLECGPCMLEPVMDEILHGECSEKIKLLTMSEVTEVKGYFGNFIVQIKETPRYVDIDKCIGCSECIPVCPVSLDNEYNSDLDKRNAIAFPFLGSLPNAPFIDEKKCLRTTVSDESSCALCLEACPVPEAILYDDKEKFHEVKVGAIVVAVGSTIYDCKKMPNLNYGNIKDIYTNLEFERIINGMGPTNGQIVTSEGKDPESIAILHCVGSLDKNHMDYCSGTCCQSAFKYNHIISKNLPDTKITHIYKHISVSGKEEHKLYHEAKGRENSKFISYEDIKDLNISGNEAKKVIEYNDYSGAKVSFDADMVILCPAIVPSGENEKLGKILETTTDEYGFFEELHSRVDSVRSKIKGIYVTGTCQSPMDIQKAMVQGMASSGYILSSLVEGRNVELEAFTASVTEERCSGCRTCGLVCPYKAITFNSLNKKSEVNPLLCQGCGTCVSACPSGAIIGSHFTDQEICAEIEGILA